MRNLVLIEQKVKKLPYDNINTFTIETKSDLDNSNPENIENVSYFCSDTTGFSSNYYSNKTQKLFEIDTSKKIIGIECLALDRELSYACDNGDVWIYDLNADVYEVVTFCEDGLAQMSWSPDQETVIFVTRANKVVLMRRDFEVISETYLDDTAFGDQEFITVGWGKKETQFHGSEGKEAAKNKIENISIPENLEKLDKSVSITWRYDGELYAISYLGKIGRVFKIFNKEGVLQSTSEKCFGLESRIAWRPSGLWIAIPQIFSNKYVIALFEKNGLRHREIILPFREDKEIIIDLSWSFDSEILSIVTLNKETNCSMIYLYTIMNYHWYLKQTLSFKTKVACHRWNFNSETASFNPKTLQVCLADSTFIVYKWIYRVDHSFTFSVKNESVTGVIDGSNLLLTNFRGSVVPPPMCSFTLKHDKCINFIGFIRQSDEDPNQFFIFDCENNLIIYKITFSNPIGEIRNIKSVEKISYFKHLIDSDSDIPLSCYPSIWITNDKMVFVNQSNVNVFGMVFEENRLIPLYKDTLEKINGLTNFKNNGFIVGNASTFEVYTFDQLNGLGHKPSDVFICEETCERFIGIDIDGEMNIIYLTNNQICYHNNKQITAGVTSFYWNDFYLLFTTFDELNFYDVKEKQIIQKRKIETGARIVVVVPKTSKVLLQLPRGNLELINPRILSIKIIGEHLNNLKYHDAFDILRRERINLNIIVDHNYQKFIENIDQFLKQIQNPNWLNLFLSELQNDDVTVTMYASSYKHLEKYLESYNKIEIISKYMCDRMEAKDQNGLMLPIITSYVQRKNIEKALSVIWETKKIEVLTSMNQRVTADEALKYLIYLVDVNELYKVALGMYDLDLVMFVANKSQKDPKEYLPFLNGIKSIADKNYQKYTIDNHLKRFKNALMHIIKCNEPQYFEECKILIEKQSLFSYALSMLPINSDKYRQIAKIFGDFLRLKACLSEACTMYERGGDLKQALVCAKNLLDYQLCVSILKKDNANETEIFDAACSLIAPLEKANRHLEAADILTTIKKDIYEAVQVLVRGKLFHTAAEIATEKQPNLIDEVIRPIFETSTKEYLIFLDENFNEFMKHKKRLLVVREFKKKLPNYGFNEADDFDDQQSMFSGQSTRTGSSSRNSSKSSKNRRKMERKLHSLKEGNPYEELALIEELNNLINFFIKQKIYISSLLSFTIQYCMDHIGVHIQQKYKSILQSLKKSVDDVFINDMKFPEYKDLNVYMVAQKSRYYSFLDPNLRIKPNYDFEFSEYEILNI